MGLILLAKKCIKKILPATTRLVQVTAIIVLFSIMCGSIDLVLICNHYDPLLALPIMFIGDGGSGRYLGPFYTVSKHVAYELGNGENPSYDYYLKLWFIAKD